MRWDYAVIWTCGVMFGISMMLTIFSPTVRAMILKMRKIKLEELYRNK